MEIKITKWNIFILLFISIAFLYFYISFTSPTIFGDEGFYSSIGRWITENGLYPNYNPYHQTDIFHLPLKKPPLFLLFNTIFWIVGGEIGLRFMVPVFILLSSLMTFILFKKINYNVALFSAIILLLINGLITHGLFNYVESSLVLFFILFIHFTFRAFEENSWKLFTLSGIFSALCILTDTTGLFSLFIFILYFFIKKKINLWKYGLLFLIIVLIITAPFFIKNLILYNGFCYPFLPGECPPIEDINILHSNELGEGVISIIETGTAMNILKMGPINYFIFAFGISITILLAFGISCLIFYKGKMKRLLIIWLCLFILFTIQQSFSGGRAEDIPRYTLFGFPIIAITCGLFLSMILKNTNKYLGIILIIIICSFILYEGYYKIISINSVKNQFGGLINACDWVKDNTEKESLLFSIYGHHSSFACDRNTISGGLPDHLEISLTYNDTSYEHLKLHGFDYVFVEMFTMTEQKSLEGTNPAFLNYLETSEHFKNVFDNTDKYGNMGIKIFEVLE